MRQSLIFLNRQNCCRLEAVSSINKVQGSAALTLPQKPSKALWRNTCPGFRPPAVLRGQTSMQSRLQSKRKFTAASTVVCRDFR